MKLAVKQYYALACFVFWVTVGLMMIIWYEGQGAISYIASSGIKPYVLLLVGVWVVTVLVIKFLQGFFFEHVGASKTFKTAYYAAYVFIILTALVPASNGLVESVHILFANIVSLLSLYIFILLVFNNKLRLSVRTYISVASVVSIVLVLKSESVVTQSLSLLIGQSCIIAVTYMGISNERYS